SWCLRDRASWVAPGDRRTDRKGGPASAGLRLPGSFRGGRRPPAGTAREDGAQRRGQQGERAPRGDEPRALRARPRAARGDREARPLGLRQPLPREVARVERQIEVVEYDAPPPGAWPTARRPGPSAYPQASTAFGQARPSFAGMWGS